MDKKVSLIFFQLTLIFLNQLHLFQERKSSAIAVQKASKTNASAPY